MNTKTKLRDYLRQARVDAPMRNRLLDNARFSKKCFGWLTVMWGLFILVDLVGVRWGYLTDHSISTWVSIVLALALYDKFADRIAMLESLEEMPNQMPEPPGAGSPVAHR